MQKRSDSSLGKDFVFRTDKKEVEGLSEKVGITMEWLKNPSKLNVLKEQITKGLMLELRKARIRYNFPLKLMSEWVYILCESDEKPNVGALQKQLDSIYKKQLSLKKISKEKKEDYLKQIYTVPKRKLCTTCTGSANESQKNVAKN